MSTHFKRNISLFSLTMTGVTTIVGSGWLLGTQKIAELAGPSAILAWCFGALIALLVGLFYVEIGSAHPSAGGIGYYSHVTHGRFCGFLTSWINWLSIVAVAPLEAQATIQYLSEMNPTMMLLYNLQNHNLTHIGILTAICLMLLFMLINYWSVQFYIRFNNIFTLIKVAVPILTIVVLFAHGLHYQNFGHNEATFMPGGMRAIFVSIISAGVVMSFNGFQSPMTFSEEIKSPKKMLPIAVAGSIIFALILYVLLEAVFIGSVDPSKLAQVGFAGLDYRSPYVDLLMLANIQIMVTIIYAGSLISPGVCAVTFLASSSRILYSLSYNKHLPQFLSMLHAKYRTPRNAIISCTVMGCLFLFLFKGWYQLVAVISVLHVFSYVAAPIITIANRIKHKALLKAKDQFMLKGGLILAPILLFILSCLLFYAAWPLAAEMLVLVLPGLVFYFYYESLYHKEDHFLKSFKGASWLVLYIIGISIIAFLGNRPSVAHNLISMPTSMILLALLSLFTFIYGAFFALER